MDPSAPLERLTARLRLRQFSGADHAVYAAMSADADVMRHIGAGGPLSADDAWRSRDGSRSASSCRRT